MRLQCCSFIGIMYLVSAVNNGRDKQVKTQCESSYLVLWMSQGSRADSFKQLVTQNQREGLLFEFCVFECRSAETHWKLLCLSTHSDVFMTDSSRVSAATVASTAIAAAQWAVTQVARPTTHTLRHLAESSHPAPLLTVIVSSSDCPERLGRRPGCRFSRVPAGGSSNIQPRWERVLGARWRQLQGPGRRQGGLPARSRSRPDGRVHSRSNRSVQLHTPALPHSNGSS